ncbi:MAG: phosphatase PAP2 family protein [Oscillochloris sp.]|nr:phosphatase PAP2 family protein [Oscillochloris sp.]
MKERSIELRRYFTLVRTLIYNKKRRHRLLLISGMLALAIVVVLTFLASVYTVLPLDVWFTRELQEDQGVIVNNLMYAVSCIGYMPWSAITVLLGSLLVGVFLNWRDGVYLAAITVVQGVINAAIKGTIGRPRPLEDLVEVLVSAPGFSFPSGHVMFYTVFFGFLLFRIITSVSRKHLRLVLGLPCAALVVAVGPSRIILGVHWLTDVIAAYLLGLVILLLAIEFYLHYLAPTTIAHR